MPCGPRAGHEVHPPIEPYSLFWVVWAGVEILSLLRGQVLSLCDVYSLLRRVREYPPCQIFRLRSHHDQEEHSQFEEGYETRVDVRSATNRKAKDGSLFGFEFVYLLDMDRKTSCGVQATRTHVTLEMFCLLVLHENCIATQVRIILVYSKAENTPFSSSNSRSQYQHHGRMSWHTVGQMGLNDPRREINIPACSSSSSFRCCSGGVKERRTRKLFGDCVGLVRGKEKMIP